MFEPGLVLLCLVPVAFGVTGGVLAAHRGRNFILWGLSSAVFPICIMIVWFEKPLKEVKGRFKKCAKCGEWLKWIETPCRYCGNVSKVEL
jgi:hypothetical protein